MTEQTNELRINLTAEIVSAFVSNHSIRASELPDLIASTHAALVSVGATKHAEEEATSELKPAVTIKKSVTDEYIVCLDDGRKFKSLKRHLADLGMTPDEYRTKWNLPTNYPMVAPVYAAKRSALAKTMGLGRKAAAASVEPTPNATPANDAAPKRTRAAAKRADKDGALTAGPLKRRGRPKKAA